MIPCDHGLTEQFKSAYKELKWHGCLNKYVLHLLTLSGRFRFGFCVGNIYNTIEY